jgi:tetratricopeptide (TPR) repeat protein
MEQYLLSRALAEPQTRRLCARREARMTLKILHLIAEEKLVFSRACAYSAGAFMRSGGLWIVPLFLVACAGLRTDSEFLAGRQAFLRGEPDNARSFFDRVAQSDPRYVSREVSPPRSIWTYVGRAEYNAGRYAQAQSAFEKALSQVKEDYIAQLYLGLTRLRPREPGVSSKAFSLQEVTYALREGIDPKRVATLARERGVAFDLNKETENQLETVGANNLLLDELKKIRAENTKGSRATDAQRSQGAKELGEALTGLRDWLVYTISYTPQGKFWDPAERIRNQLQLCLKMLDARPPNWDALIANAEWVGSMFEEESDKARRDETAERNRQLRR